MAEIDNLSVDTERLAKEAADNTDNFCNAVQKGDVQHQENLRLKAFTSLDRMMKITSGQTVQWPEKFVAPI